MKTNFLMTGLLMAACLAPVARGDEDLAGPTQDLTPVSLRIRKVTGEFGGASLQITVGVKNVGSLRVRGSRGGVHIGSISNPSAPLYGTNGNLGAEIPPGKTGMFLVYAPLTALRHCQAVRVSIDTAHQLQSGTTLVFYNDSKVLTAIDPSSLKACIGAVKP